MNRRYSRRRFVQKLGYASGSMLLANRLFGLDHADFASRLFASEVPLSSEVISSDFDKGVRETIGNRHKRLVITGLNVKIGGPGFTLNEDFEDLFVFSDEIHLEGDVVLPGKDVFLHARIITASLPTLINVSGIDGPPAVPATRSFNPGDPGNPGGNGNIGGPGGTIRVITGSLSGNIKFRANGGRGSDGAAGGNGVQGQNGTPGGTVGGAGKDQQGLPGNKGGTGGQAGKGGAGGPGGLAGVIQIFTLGIPPTLSESRLTEVHGVAYINPDTVAESRIMSPRCFKWVNMRVN
jgi:hypothetical protein